MFMDYFNQSTGSKSKSMTKLFVSILLTCLLIAFTGLSFYGCKSALSNESSLLDGMVECSTELVFNATATVSTFLELHSVSN